MRRTLPLILLLSCALAMDAAAQGTRPPRDTVRVGSRPAGDSIQMAEFDADDDDARVDADDAEDADPAADTVPEPKPGPYARSGGTGPFTVQAAGEVAPRPERGEVVWVNTPAPRAAAADSARRPGARDTTRAGSGQRVTSGQTTRRDTASASRPAGRDTARTGSGQRVTSGQTTRRDTTSASRPAGRDTARTGSGQRVTSGQTTRRDTTSASRPTGRDTARTGSGQRVTSGQTTRRDTASATRPNRPAPRDTIRPGSQRTGTSTPAAGSGSRPRAHTVAAGETFYGIARRYGVTAAQLRALNPGVDMNELEVGDVLRLPAGARDSRAPAQPRTGSGAQPQQGRTQAQPARGSRTHTVQAGETLFGIARRYGVTVDAIRRANEMESDQVRTGQRLVIPPAS